MPANPNIALANERVAMTQVCRDIGMSLPDDVMYANMKLYCPFGDFAHADGGMGKAFRLYETNTAYCFACGKLYRPVSLLADARDITPEEAAEILLEQSGYQPEDLESRWSALQDVSEPVNTDYLAEALKVYCARISPAWEDRQLDDDVAGQFRRCLELLPNVTTDEAAKKWLAATKHVMRSILE